MSSVAFHTKTRTERVRGPERHHWAILIGDVFHAALHPDVGWDDPIYRLVEDQPFRGADPTTWRATDRLFWTSVVGDRYFVLPNGDRVGFNEAALNTALVMGSDPWALMAHLHARCESHLFVKEHDREWLADLIVEGMAVGLFRADMGWAEAMAMIHATDEFPGPVVTSHSVTDGWPNQSVADWEPPRIGKDLDRLDYDAWDELTDDERWDYAMAGLLKTEHQRLMPSRLHDYFYGPRAHHRWDAFNLRALSYELKAAAPVGEPA